MEFPRAKGRGLGVGSVSLDHSGGGEQTDQRFDRPGRQAGQAGSVFIQCAGCCKALQQGNDAWVVEHDAGMGPRRFQSQHAPFTSEVGKTGEHDRAIEHLRLRLEPKRGGAGNERGQPGSRGVDRADDEPAAGQALKHEIPPAQLGRTPSFEHGIGQLSLVLARGARRCRAKAAASESWLKVSRAVGPSTRNSPSRLNSAVTAAFQESRTETLKVAPFPAAQGCSAVSRRSVSGAQRNIGVGFRSSSSTGRGTQPSWTGTS